MVKGKKKLKAGVEHAVLDSLGPGGGLAGAKLGGALGLFAAPFLAEFAVYALPVLMVVGAWVGSHAGRKVGARVRARRVFQALRKVHRAAKTLKRTFLAAFPKLLREIESAHEAQAALVRSALKKNRNFFMRFFFPNLMTTFFLVGLLRLQTDRAEELKLWKLVRRRTLFA